MKRARRGFTLLEVLVGLVLTGIVALLAHQLFGAAANGRAQLSQARLGIDRHANAHQFLSAAFLSLEVGLPGAEPFAGGTDRVRFSAWLPTPDGWPERRAVELGRVGDRWVATIGSDQKIVLASGVTAVRFDYLMEPGAGSGWAENWESAASAPLALRVRVRRARGAVDTMVYLIKGRG